MGLLCMDEYLDDNKGSLAAVAITFPPFAAYKISIGIQVM